MTTDIFNGVKPDLSVAAIGVAWDTQRQRWFSLLADDPPPSGLRGAVMALEESLVGLLGAGRR